MSSMPAHGLRLRELPFGARLGLSLLLLVNLGGFTAAAMHLVEHHQNRDGQAGLAIADIEGAYHGVARIAPLRTVLEAGHPSELAPELLAADARAALLAWVLGERITEDYDNLDLDPPPADRLDQSCLPCHSRNASPDKKVAPYLDYWDDVKPLAFSSEVQPVSTAILIASTHTHAIGLASISLVFCLLLALSSWPRGLTSLLSLLIGSGLAIDLSAMWLMRSSPSFVYALLAGGWMFNAAIGLSSILLLCDLWRPKTRAGAQDLRAGT